MCIPTKKADIPILGRYEKFYCLAYFSPIYFQTLLGNAQTAIEIDLSVTVTYGVSTLSNICSWTLPCLEL